MCEELIGPLILSHLKNRHFVPFSKATVLSGFKIGCLLPLPFYLQVSEKCSELYCRILKPLHRQYSRINYLSKQSNYKRPACSRLNNIFATAKRPNVIIATYQVAKGLLPVIQFKRNGKMSFSRYCRCVQWNS